MVLMSRDFKTHAPQSNKNVSSSPTSKPSLEANVSREKAETKNAVTGETGGPSGEAEPTQFGDWSVNGRCVDF